MDIGDKFIYTRVSSDWRFGKQCEIVGEVGGCWIVQVVGFPDSKPVWMNKNLFPMPLLSEEEIEGRRKKARRIAGIF